MSVVSKVFGVLLMLATLAVGAFVDIVLLLVGGITELVHGIQASAGGEIGWGIAHILFSGVGFFVAVGLCFLWGFLFFGMSWNKSRKNQRVIRPTSRMQGRRRVNL